MGLTKDTLTRRLALAMQLTADAGGPDRLDALEWAERTEEIKALEVRFRNEEDVTREAARGWISKALRRQRHPARQRGTAPDTSLHLGAERREWLQAQGGIQPTIQRLIDQAMNDGKESR